jgi:hypothetical protein
MQTETNEFCIAIITSMGIYKIKNRKRACCSRKWCRGSLSFDNWRGVSRPLLQRHQVHQHQLQEWTHKHCHAPHPSWDEDVPTTESPSSKRMSNARCECLPQERDQLECYDPFFENRYGGRIEKWKRKIPLSDQFNKNAQGLHWYCNKEATLRPCSASYIFLWAPKSFGSIFISL